MVGTSGLAGAGESALEWIANNALLVFAAAATFVVFRPDKTLFGRR